MTTLIRISLLASIPTVAILAQQSRLMVPQTGADSLRWTSVGFERVLNTFLWNGRVRYEGTWGRTTVRTDQSLRSRLIRADQEAIQDEYNATTALSSVFAHGWRLRAKLVSNVLSDNRLIDLGQLAQHQALAGLEYGPTSALSVAALGGFEYNSQGNERDGGLMYLIGLNGTGLQLEEFRANLSAASTQSFIQPRRQRDDSLAVWLGREFGADARNELSFRMTNQRREFYTAADAGVQRLFDVRSNVFRREARVMDVLNVLHVKMSDGFRLTLRGGWSTRTIERGSRYKDFSGLTNTALDTRVEEFQLLGSLDAAYRLAGFIDGWMEISYREREERHSVVSGEAPADVVQRQESATRRLGNVARETVLRSSHTLQVSERNQLNLVGSASILRYDTPDTLNTDDRDELYLTFGLMETYTASPAFRVTVLADVVLNHLVYLHRMQSANNYWNRIIRFSPKVEYAPVAWLRTINRAEVLANYTVFDFEEQVAFVRSFSFRQASWSDSTVLRLTPRLAVHLVGELRVYERGILRWREFKERPQNYFVELSLWPELGVTLGRFLVMGIGYRTFQQDRYRYAAGVRELERSLHTSGPTARVEWEAPGVARISVRGWREHQQEDGKTVRTLSNLFMTMNIAF